MINNEWMNEWKIPFLFLYSKYLRADRVKWGKKEVLRKAFSQQQVPNAMNRQQMENKDWGRCGTKGEKVRQPTGKCQIFLTNNTIQYTNTLMWKKECLLPCLYLILVRNWSHRYRSSPPSLDLAKGSSNLQCYQPGTQSISLMCYIQNCEWLKFQPALHIKLL